MAENVVKLRPPPRRSVVVTIDDYGGTFSLRASGANGWEDSDSLKKYLESAFSSWCYQRQDERWITTKARLNAEYDALPWWRRLGKVRFT